jgi:hypothetical protein
MMNRLMKRIMIMLLDRMTPPRTALDGVRGD